MTVAQAGRSHTRLLTPKRCGNLRLRAIRSPVRYVFPGIRRVSECCSERCLAHNPLVACSNHAGPSFHSALSFDDRRRAEHMRSRDHVTAVTQHRPLASTERSAAQNAQQQNPLVKSWQKRSFWLRVLLGRRQNPTPRSASFLRQADPSTVVRGQTPANWRLFQRCRRDRRRQRHR